jgi:hypothetical protein
MNTKTIGIVAAALIIGFGAGYYLHPATTPQSGTAAGTFTRNGGPGGMRGGGANGGFLSGSVAAKDATSITLNTRDGSSHVVLITPETSVSKSVTGALTDVSIGSNVMIVGASNSDGSVSATNIQLRAATSTPFAR